MPTDGIGFVTVRDLVTAEACKRDRRSVSFSCGRVQNLARHRGLQRSRAAAIKAQRSLRRDSRRYKTLISERNIWNAGLPLALTPTQQPC